MEWAELLKYLGSGAAGALLTALVLLVRERNNFAAKTMDLLIADKKAWAAERKQLESRIDYLYEKVDKLNEKLLLVSAAAPPGTATAIVAGE